MPGWIGHPLPSGREWGDRIVAGMTSTAAGTRPANLHSADAARLFRLRAAVVIAPIGPVAIGLVRGFLPYDTVDEPATIVAKIASQPAVSNLVLWLAYLALLTLPLGVLIAGRAAIRVRPVFGAVAATVAWLGFLSLFGVGGSETTALVAHDAGVDLDAVVRLGTATEALLVSNVASMVFVVGHIVGGVLLGIALWRAIPHWAAVALAISQPLHLLFAVFVTNHWADAVAWSLTGVGFAAAAFATLQHFRQKGGRIVVAATGPA